MVLSACLEVVVQLSSACSVVKHGCVVAWNVEGRGNQRSGLGGYTHKHISGFLDGVKRDVQAHAVVLHSGWQLSPLPPMEAETSLLM